MLDPLVFPFWFRLLPVAVLVLGVLSCEQHSVSSVKPIRLVLQSLASGEDEIGRRNYAAKETRGYWRKDVAGLCALAKGIPPEVATADLYPLPENKKLNTPVPVHGYFLAALKFPGEQGLADGERFAIGAFPARYESDSRHVYVVMKKENAIHIYRKDCGPGGTVPFGAVPSECENDPKGAGWVELEGLYSP